MRIDILQARRTVMVGVVVLVAALVVVLWWASPARSQSGPDAVDTFAFVARADNPVDALAASSVAGQLGAPVYLTFPGSLDDQAAQGLEATAPDVVVLAGGTAALSEQVEGDIRDLLPDAEVVRKAGFGRTETAKLINELTGELGIDRPMLAGATVTGDFGIDGTLTVDGTDLGEALAALTARVDSLETDLAAANGRIGTLETDLVAAEGRIGRLEATLAGVDRSGDTLVFSGMNVQVVNGQGATHTTNGLGNLIVGYNEDHTDTDCRPDVVCQYFGDGVADARSGSHNLVVGVDHTYSSYAGLLAGLNNTTSGIFASVSGGQDNTASGQLASVSGGRQNTASSMLASVSGGQRNTASEYNASVSGGFRNTASSFYASVSGGSDNTASGQYASVSAGFGNSASGQYASVSGGQANAAHGVASSVSAGHVNTASGRFTSVAGGFDGDVPDELDSLIGDQLFPDG